MRIDDFFLFCGTNFCDFDGVVFLAGNYLSQFSLSSIYNAVNFRHKFLQLVDKTAKIERIGTPQKFLTTRYYLGIIR